MIDQGRAARTAGIALPCLAFFAYVVTVLLMPGLWSGNYCCERPSFAAAVSHVVYGTPVATIRPDVYDYFVRDQHRSLTELLAGIPGLRAGSAAISAADQAAKARDLQRLADGHRIGQALAAFFRDHAAYPPTPEGKCPDSYHNLAGLTEQLVPQYLASLPEDPAPPTCEYNYLYRSESANYALLIHLETLDPVKYSDHWCIAAGNGPVSGFETYLPCPDPAAIEEWQSVEMQARGSLIRAINDGNGIGYALVATAAFLAFGLHAWALVLTMLIVMGVSAAALLWRFGGSGAVVVTLYFVALTVMLFTPITWLSDFAEQIAVSGIRYFSLAAVLPTLHILLELADPPGSGRRRRRDDALLGLQVAIFAIVLLVRGSVGAMVGAIATLLVVQLWRHRRQRQRLRPLFRDLVVIIGVGVGLLIALVMLMPREYRTEGRTGTVFWHRAVLGLGLHPAFPFPGLNEMYADCKREIPEGLVSGVLDQNGACIWFAHQIRHNLPSELTEGNIYGEEYEAALRDEVLRIVAHYPRQILDLIFYYKPKVVLQSLRSGLQVKLPTAAPDAGSGLADPYRVYTIGLLAMALAIGLVHATLASYGSILPITRLVPIMLWVAAWTFPPYLVAWAYPVHIVDLEVVIIVLAGITLGAVIAAGWRSWRGGGLIPRALCAPASHAAISPAVTVVLWAATLTISLWLIVRANW